MSSDSETSDPGLAERVEALGLAPIVTAAGAMPVYVVGGAIRDLLLGRAPQDVANLDLAVEGDAIELARRLGGEQPREHERFGTATVRVGSREVDLARTRTETYARPGALPDVEAASLAEDLGRRDFSVNAMAVALATPGDLIDPHGGRIDLEARLLRTLHPASFADDPTRAARAARYAARLGFELEVRTEEALRQADLTAVSSERIESELTRLLAEAEWRRGFELLAEWGLAPGAELDLMAAVDETLARPAWIGAADESTAMLVAGAPPVGAYAPSAGPRAQARRLAELDGHLPPSELATAAREVAPVALVVARAMGAEWLDRYVEEWRDVRLEISGEDLLAAGVDQGPAVGRGLAAAMAARLDRGVEERDSQLQVALGAARERA